MIRRPRLVAASAAVIAVLGLAAPSASASSPSPTAARLPAAAASNVSAYTYLKTHDGKLDSNWNNFSIATALLRDLSGTSFKAHTGDLFSPRQKLTFFVPTDRALQVLLKQVTGNTYATEANVLNKLEQLLPQDVDALLGSGVVPGRTLSASAVLASSGKNLVTEWGDRSLHVAVYGSGSRAIVSLWDQDHRLRNARVILARTNLNPGNPQILHGVDRAVVGFHERMARSWFVNGEDSLSATVHAGGCSPALPCTGGSSGHG